MEGSLHETLADPEQVVLSVGDPDVRLYYRQYPNTLVGDKLLCVVVKVGPDDAFVITAYLTDSVKPGESFMSARQVKVWYDPEGDYLEVIFEQREGLFQATNDDRVMEKVDTEGNLLGFSILGVSSLKGSPLEVDLP